MAITPMSRIGVGALRGTAVSVPFLIVSFFAAGFGHGTYKPMMALFPYTMLWAVLGGLITMPAIILGLIQFPTYGALIAWSTSKPRLRRLAWVLGAMHVGAAVVAFRMAATSGFWP
jgi:hypothetical protein